MKVFTVNRTPSPGAPLLRRTFGTTTLRGLVIGENGRYHKESFRPVIRIPAELDTIMNVTLGGNNTLIWQDQRQDTDTSQALIWMPTEIGFRGGNFHGGEFKGEEYLDRAMVEAYRPMPGRVIAEGTISQGAAGRMGSGSQFLVVMPANEVWYIRKTGRTYGNADRWYYLFDGEQVHCLTPDDRHILEEVGQSPMPNKPK